MMTQNIKNGDCTPHLRFPEFQKTTKWKDVILGDICSFFKGKGISKDEISQDGKIPCIRYGELYTHYSETINVIHSYTNIDENNLFFSKKNDILIPSSGETKEDIAKASCLLLDNVALGSDLHVLRVDQNQIFISYYINYGIKENISKVAQGDTVVHLYSNQLKNIKLCLPLLQEQQKIADCLTSLDDLITAHEQKAEALRQHKKGLMQRLLPAEGETTPRWRFPEFREAEEWTSHPLGTMTTKIRSGVTPKGGDKNYLKAGIPFVRSQNIGWGKLLLSDLAFIPRELHKKFLSTEILYNDVLLNITGASIGRCAIVEKNISGGNVNQHVCIIRTNENKLNSIFLMQYMISVQGQKQIDSFQAGGNRQGLNFAQIAAFTIPTPSLPEQQKIADCLSALDERIAAEEAKIAALREHKKGLMQRLFP